MAERSDPISWRCVHCQVFVAPPNWLTVQSPADRRCPACGQTVPVTELTPRLRLTPDAIGWLPPST